MANPSSRMVAPNMAQGSRMTNPNMAPGSQMTNSNMAPGSGMSDPNMTYSNPETKVMGTEQEMDMDTQSKKYEAQPDSQGNCGVVEILAVFFSTLLVLVTLPLSIWFCFKVVREYERAVIFRLGRLRSGGARGPGTFCILPCLDDYRCVDLRTVFFDVPPQEILTHDSVTVEVDAVIYYRVYNPVVAIANVADFSNSTRLLAATMLRNVLGTKSLSQILTDRESITNLMQIQLDEATDPWGVKVERVEMKDVRLPQQLQRAMAAEAEASREARAKVIAAEGELNASKALKEAADVMVTSPGALQLRYLQTLGTIAAEKNSTIIFPLPIDLLAPFLRR